MYNARVTTKKKNIHIMWWEYSTSILLPQNVRPPLWKALEHSSSSLPSSSSSFCRGCFYSVVYSIYIYMYILYIYMCVYIFHWQGIYGFPQQRVWPKYIYSVFIRILVWFVIESLKNLFPFKNYRFLIHELMKMFVKKLHRLFLICENLFYII